MANAIRDKGLTEGGLTPPTVTAQTTTEEVPAASGQLAPPLEPIGTRRSLQDRPLARIVKRAFDLLASSLGLIALAPFLLLIAVAIKVDSRGPAFFLAGRVGRRGQPFRILKFRTMVDGAHLLQDDFRHLNEAGDGTFKLSRDPRVTRVGAWLRATSLDEIPQLVNVIIGQMSLVGPRPLSQWEEDLVNAGRGRQLQIQPGITGLWQVSGHWKLPLQDRVALEATYEQTWTMRSDIVLLAKTLRHVIQRRGV